MEAIIHKLILLTFLFVHAVNAEEQMGIRDGAESYPTRPNGQRDWRANYYRVDKGEIVTIRPDGKRDWSAKSYRIDGDILVPFTPQGKRDWNAPTIILKKN